MSNIVARAAVYITKAYMYAILALMEEKNTYE